MSTKTIEIYVFASGVVEVSPDTTQSVIGQAVPAPARSGSPTLPPYGSGISSVDVPPVVSTSVQFSNVFPATVVVGQPVNWPSIYHGLLNQVKSDVAGYHRIAPARLKVIVKTFQQLPPDPVLFPWSEEPAGVHRV